MTDWEHIFQRVLPPDATEREIVGSLARPRTCRFCLRTAPDARFRSEAHVLPRGVGNRTLLSSEECDDCNQAGSVVENDVVTVLSMARGIAMVRPREPTYKIRRSNRTASHVAVRPGVRKMDFIVPDLRDRDVRVRRTHDGFTVDVALPPFRPANIAKALARMAWFVLPDDVRQNNDHIRRWIRGEERWPRPAVWLTDLQCKGTLSGPVFEVLRPRQHTGWTTPVLGVSLALGRSAAIVYLPDRSWLLPEIPAKGMRIDAEEHALYKGLVHSLRVALPDVVVPRLTHEQVSQGAYFRYLRRPPDAGDPVNDWLEAEQDLLWQQIGFEPSERPS